MRRSVPSRLRAAVGRGRARRLASRGGVGSPPSTPLGCRSLVTGPSEGMTLSPSCVTDSVRAGPLGRRATLAESRVLPALT